MNKLRLACLTVICTFISAAALQTETWADEPAAIHFADLGGIKNWRSGPENSLLIEGRNGNWYRATFWGPCYEIKFAEAVAFVTEPNGDLDKFSSVLVGGQRCWFRTLERTTMPQRKTDQE